MTTHGIPVGITAADVIAATDPFLEKTDAANTYATKDQPRMTGDLVLADTAGTAQFILDSGASGASHVLLRSGGATRGEFLGLSNRMLVRRRNSGAGTDTTLELYDDYVTSNKEVRTGGVRLAEDSSNGSSSIGLYAPDSTIDTYNIIFPSTKPAAGQRLEVDTVSGANVTMKWVTP